MFREGGTIIREVSRQSVPPIDALTVESLCQVILVVVALRKPVAVLMNWSTTCFLIEEVGGLDARRVRLS